MSPADSRQARLARADAPGDRATGTRSLELPVESGGHGWTLAGRLPEAPVASMLWLPALGVAARHYLPFAEALAVRGVATWVHEWRGHGSSNVRAGRGRDWGYRALLREDIPASQAAVAAALPGVPRLVGGHSLGGQLACCRLALDPAGASGLWLVASGAPYWRAFPAPTRWGLPLAYRFLPWLADRAGALPGRRIGFGGREARGVMRDWARTALSGRYAARGLDTDLEAGMRTVEVATRAALFTRDWLAPRQSLDFLLSKLPASPAEVRVFDRSALGTRPDHFHWMRTPGAVADWLCEGAPAGGTPAR